MKRYIIAKLGSSTYYCDDKEKIILEKEEDYDYCLRIKCEDIMILSKFVMFDDLYDTDIEPFEFKKYRED